LSARCKKDKIRLAPKQYCAVVRKCQRLHKDR
jgi:hypothetical protein